MSEIGTGTNIFVKGAYFLIIIPPALCLLSWTRLEFFLTRKNLKAQALFLNVLNDKNSSWGARAGELGKTVKNCTTCFI